MGPSSVCLKHSRCFTRAQGAPHAHQRHSITFLVVILVLYLINLLPLDGRAKQIARVVVIIIGVISLLKYSRCSSADRERPPIHRIVHRSPHVVLAAPGSCLRSLPSTRFQSIVICFPASWRS